MFEMNGASYDEAANCNADSMSSTAISMFYLISIIGSLSESWSTVQSKDLGQYEAASFATLGEPSEQPIAAAWYARYEMDENQGQKEIAYHNNIIQVDEAQEQTDGQSLSNIDVTAQPLNQLLSWLETSVNRFLKG